MQRFSLGIVFLFSFLQVLRSQPDRWQQKVAYTINVDMDVSKNRFSGTEQIDYWNNSPDTLHRLFFHLYWNAFQPGSMMDVRSRELGKNPLGTDKNGNPVYDWDPRVTDRISKLTPEQMGYDSVDYVKVNGVSQKLVYHETVLDVQLSRPILPHTKAALSIAFKNQVPVQIRRSGRDNAEGVRYSMSQWYPKLAEYDWEGWHADPYVAREFYGVWGNFDVNITIDKNYMLAGTGTILNADEVGYGYATDKSKAKSQNSKLTWKFSAQNVHDFMWAADTSYTLIKKQISNGPLFYFVYKKSEAADKSWTELADKIEKAYPFIEKNFGAHPYKNFSFVQGGDGGMEYPMSTLIKNTGAAIHEFMHSWYYGVLGSDESEYPWMDEGFATYAETKVNAFLRDDSSSFIFNKSYDSYFNLAKSGREEPLSTHGDHYDLNYAYSNASYSKGCVFLAQLGYIVGDSVLSKILLRYYNDWRFKHPNPDDFIRIAENISGLELKWYKQYWVYSTKTIDYALGAINNNNGNAEITLKRLGLMPMPVDVQVTYKDGSSETYYIPLDLMYGSKRPETSNVIIKEEWKWVNPEYTLSISKGVSDIKSVEIDPSLRMADMNRVNNKLIVP